MKYAEGKRRQDEMRRRVELLSPGGLRGRPMLQYVEQMALVHPVWQYGALSISASIDERGGSEWLHVCFSKPDRVPTHDDLMLVRRTFFRRESVVVQVFPPADEYVNDFPYALHLWERLGEQRLVPDLRTAHAGRLSL